MPSQLTSGRSPVINLCTASNAMYGASRKNWAATSFCARRSAACEWMREPLKRHTMTPLANPSMAESMPNPTSAIEPASTPATIATVPSAPIQTRLIHESCLTRRTACRSAVAWAKAADLELRGRS